MQFVSRVAALCTGV